jgi:phage shock protein A
MYGALFRWLKAVGYLLTGRMDAARRLLDTNPHVVRAKFDEIVRDKTSRVQQYKQAVAALIAQQESKMAKVKALTEEVRNLENLKTGALAKARQRVARLQGQDRPKEDIQKDEEYLKCLGAYNDFSSTLTEKQARIAELETDIQEYSRRIGEHKVQLQALVREIEKVKAEAADTVADMITTREEKEIADTLSGIAEDGTAKELQRMRELRQEMKAEARISGELAGTDAKAQEAEFLDYARRTTASDEFEALVGLAAKTDAGARGETAAASAEKAREKLPE